MEIKKKTKLTALTLLCGNLACFFAAHFSYLFDAPVFQYIHLYALKLWEFFYVVLAARILLLIFSHSRKKFAGALAVFTLTRAAYYLPFYYEQMVLESGYPSDEAILLSFISTILVLVFTAIHLSLFFGIGLAVAAVAKMKKAPSDGFYDFCLSDSGAQPTDFSSPAILLTLTVCVCEFLYTLGREVYDTVTFLASSLNSLEVGDLALMILNYVLILALFIFSHKTVSKLVAK